MVLLSGRICFWQAGLPRSSTANCLWPGLCRRPPWRTAALTHGHPSPERGLSQSAARRQTNRHQNYPSRLSSCHPLRVGTTRAPLQTCLCRGARPRRAVVGMARCAVRRPALSCPRRAGCSKIPLAKNGKAPAGTSQRNVPTKAPDGHPLGHCWGARPSRLPFSASRPLPLISTVK